MDIRKRINFTPLGDNIPQRNNGFSQRCGQLYLAMTGWRFQSTLPNLKKFIVIIVPHSSNWDFMVGAGVIFSLDIKVSFMAKHTLFWQPFGTYLRWIGGVPIDRRAAHGSVGEAVEHFKRNDKFILAITPEGTRGKVKRWKSGFYHIACAANVPIVPIAFDFGPKVIKLGDAFEPTGDKEGDFQILAKFFEGVQGKNPNNY